ILEPDLKCRRGPAFDSRRRGACVAGLSATSGRHAAPRLQQTRKVARADCVVISRLPQRMMLLHPSPLGMLRLVALERGLKTIDFSDTPSQKRTSKGHLRNAASQLDEYFTKMRRSFGLPPDLCTNGEVPPYADIARHVGSVPPAVGGACRVVANGGAI